MSRRKAVVARAPRQSVVVVVVVVVVADVVVVVAVAVVGYIGSVVIRIGSVEIVIGLASTIHELTPTSTSHRRRVLRNPKTKTQRDTTKVIFQGISVVPKCSPQQFTNCKGIIGFQ